MQDARCRDPARDLGCARCRERGQFIRPQIYRRFSEVHPLITLIGAIGGVAQFGLLGCSSARSR